MAWEMRLGKRTATGGVEDLSTDALSDVSEWVQYEPSPAPIGLTWTPGTREGAHLVDSEVGNVEESFDIYTVANARAARRLISTYLHTARLWAQEWRRDMRVVAQIRDTAYSDTWYEAQLFAGSCVRSGHVGKKSRITWVRAPYWRGPETVQQVSVDFGRTYEDYATIYNHDDAQPGHVNWLYVQAPDGNVPALTRIRVRNTYEKGRLREVRIGWSDRPVNLILEGEDALGVSVQPRANYSGEAFGQASTFRWELDYSLVRDLVGDFDVYVNGDLSDDSWKAWAGYALTKDHSGLQDYATGQDGWTYLGELTVPVGGYVEGERYPLMIWVVSEGGDQGIIDYVHLVPSTPYSRRLRFSGYNAQPGTCVEDDGIRKHTVYEWSGERIVIPVYGHNQIQLRPSALLDPANAQQMLIFGLEGDRGDANAMRTAQVQIYTVDRWDGLPDVAGS